MTYFCEAEVWRLTPLQQGTLQKLQRAVLAPGVLSPQQPITQVIKVLLA